MCLEHSSKVQLGCLCKYVDQCNIATHTRNAHTHTCGEMTYAVLFNHFGCLHDRRHRRCHNKLPQHTHTRPTGQGVYQSPAGYTHKNTSTRTQFIWGLHILQRMRSTMYVRTSRQSQRRYLGSFSRPGGT